MYIPHSLSILEDHLMVRWPRVCLCIFVYAGLMFWGLYGSRVFDMIEILIAFFGVQTNGRLGGFSI